MKTPLSRVFPDENHGFHLRFERSEPADFFAPTQDHETMIAERRRWLRSEPATYAALLPPGEPLLLEVLRLALTWNRFTPPSQGTFESKLLALGEFWESDFLMLKPDAAGEIRLYGGCLCFPSSWRLSDKLGQTMQFIHGPVPGLNAGIGPAIHKFLSGLKPGAAFLRHNWGLARSAELNHHPDRRLPRLDANAPLEEIWLRVEHQALMALPESGGILFGIRVANHSFAEVTLDAIARVRLRRALKTMPDDLACYKGLSAVRERLVALLADG